MLMPLPENEEKEYPETLHIEVTNRCNFNCIMCIRRIWNEKPSDLNIDLYKKIARSSFQKLKRLTLHGFGEPFVSPNLLSMLELSRKYLSKESEVMISTNGSLLVQQLSDRLLEGKWINELLFSIDTMDIAKLSRIRRDSKPEVIMQNLQYLTEARKTRELKIGVEVVIMKDNIEDLPNLVESLAKENVDYVVASHVLPYTQEMSENSAFTTMSRPSLEAICSLAECCIGKVSIHSAVHEILTEICDTPEPKVAEAKRQKIWGKNPDNGCWINLPLLFKSKEKLELANQVEECFHRSERIANEYGLELRFPTVSPDAKKRSCPYVEKNAIFIRSDGKVVPCMHFAYSHPLHVNMHTKGVHEVIFGDLREETLEGIWNNENYRVFRHVRKNIADDIPWCGDCVFSMGCFYAQTNDRDCIANEPGCGECLYSIGLSRCNV